MSSTSDGADNVPRVGTDPADAAATVPAGEPVEVLVPVDTRVVAIRDVTRTFASLTGQVMALDAVSLDVEARGLHVVTGPAGSGVTTLLGLIACLDRPDAGQIWVAGIDTMSASRAVRRDLRRRAIGIVHARAADNLLLDMSAGDNLAWAAKRRTGAVLTSSGIDAHLEMVGMSGAARTRVTALSGGDQQRLALACALAGEPSLVVADDPTSTLDRGEATRFVNAIRDAVDRGVCALVGSTDPLVIAAADALIPLVDGRIAS